MKTKTRIGTVPPLAGDVRALPRGPEDDFFCVRYQVWYPSFDCAVRTRFRTSEGCLQCDQGRFNEHRHAAALSLTSFHFPQDDDEANGNCGAAGTPPDL